MPKYRLKIELPDSPQDGSSIEYYLEGFHGVTTAKMQGPDAVVLDIDYGNQIEDVIADINGDSLVIVSLPERGHKRKKK